MERRSTRARTARITVGLVWLVMFLAFVLIQFRVSFAGNTYLNDPVFGRYVDADGVRFDLLVGSLRYLGASLAMVGLILGGGRRLLFSLPVLMTVGLPAIFGGVPDCFAWDQRTIPHGIGAAWSRTVVAPGCQSPLDASWGGAAVDLAMVLVPAVALVLLIGHRDRPPRTSAGSASKVLAVTICALAVVFLMSVHDLFGYPGQWTPWLSIALPLAAYGGLLGLRRSWWSLTLLVVPLALFAVQTTSVPVSFDPSDAFELVAITVAAAAWVPLVALVERARPVLARLSRREVAVPTGS
jgi:hypothetical protein